MTSEMKKGPAGENIIENINEEFDSFEAWVADNWRLIVAVAIGIVVVVGIVGTAIYVNNSIKKKTAGQFAAATSIEKLQEAINAHPSSNFAPDARMRLAMLLLDKKDFAGAIASFKAIADDKNASDTLRNKAALNSAYALELQGKLDEALASFSAIGHGSSPDDVRAEASYAAGRLYFGKNEFDKARKSLSEAHTVNPSSMSQAFWSSQAKAMLDRLEGIAPSAKAATPAPAAPLPQATVAPKAKK